MRKTNTRILLLLVANFCLQVVVGDTETKEDSSEPLYLTPYISSGQLEEGRNLAKVDRLPNATDTGPVRPSFSGFITVDSELDSHLFFWFFPALVSESSSIFGQSFLRK